MASREPTAKEVQKILELLKKEDPYKENGGLIYRDGTVTSEHNYALCRSAILLDLDSYDWKKVKALWICAELPKPPGYVDECCDGCEDRDISRLDLSKFDYAEFVSTFPRKDFVSSGQKAWADQFGITVVVYQRPYPSPAKGEEFGTWDIYDPVKTKDKAIGVNLGQLSKLAGISAVEDREHLSAVTKLAIAERDRHEAAIYEAWAKMRDAHDAGLQECQRAYDELQAKTEVLDRRVKTALHRIDRQEIRSPALTAKKSALVNIKPRSPSPNVVMPKMSVLPPASATTLDNPLFTTPPIEAFQYIEVRKI
jgi:hypothetical protein